MDDIAKSLFFDYISIEQGTIEERCNIFSEKANVILTG
jgi:hypothetical protein